MPARKHGQRDKHDLLGGEAEIQGYSHRNGHDTNRGNAQADHACQYQQEEGKAGPGACQTRLASVLPGFVRGRCVLSTLHKKMVLQDSPGQLTGRCLV
ncbi:MAG: hypothetical protein IPK02_18885 [Candidatus Accumulibacter sp.]|uniref:Uncharacterized protein n=1 Tax=Candidatus Accumulibacter affinis TaxID=2954384 RepID=A0A935W630_9PROT|nr:hypothetical protein [Candidatus Accumulibacter affinis]